MGCYYWNSQMSRLTRIKQPPSAKWLQTLKAVWLLVTLYESRPLYRSLVRKRNNIYKRYRNVASGHLLTTSRHITSHGHCASTALCTIYYKCGSVCSVVQFVSECPTCHCSRPKRRDCRYHFTYRPCEHEHTPFCMNEMLRPRSLLCRWRLGSKISHHCCCCRC